MNEILWDEEQELRESRRLLKGIVDTWRRIKRLQPSERSVRDMCDLKAQLDEQIDRAYTHLCNVQDLH